MLVSFIDHGSLFIKYDINTISLGGSPTSSHLHSKQERKKDLIDCEIEMWLNG